MLATAIPTLISRPYTQIPTSHLTPLKCVRARVCACVRACVRARLRPRVRACVRVCVRARARACVRASVRAPVRPRVRLCDLRECINMQTWEFDTHQETMKYVISGINKYIYAYIYWLYNSEVVTGYMGTDNFEMRQIRRART
jgi:hypothetical protein